MHFHKTFVTGIAIVAVTALPGRPLIRTGDGPAFSLGSIPHLHSQTFPPHNGYNSPSLPIPILLNRRSSLTISNKQSANATECVLKRAMNNGTDPRQAAAMAGQEMLKKDEAT